MNPTKIRILFTMACIFLCEHIITAEDGNSDYLRANTVYKKGVILMEGGDLEAAIEALETAVKEDRRFADAQHELARAYMQRNSLQDRIKAKHALSLALRLDNNNVEYNMTLGKLLVLEGFRQAAARQFEKIIAMNDGMSGDTNNVTMLYNAIGRLHMDEMIHFDYMISPANNLRGITQFYNVHEVIKAGIGIDRSLHQRNETIHDPEGAFSTIYRQYADKEYQAAKEAFISALNYDIKNKEANLHLAELAFYRDQYQKMLIYLNENQQYHENDKEILIYKGLCLVKLKEYKKADDVFRSAIKLMGEEEQRIYNSAEYFLPDYHKTPRKNDHINYDIHYWKSRDPLLLTPYNERQLEHYARVVEANLRFSVQENTNSSGNKAIPGWKTKRGMIFIKYGRPVVWWRMRDELGDTKRQSDISPGDYRGLEMWHYPTFAFGFHDPFSTGNSEFAPRGIFPGGFDFRDEAWSIQRNVPELTPQYVARKFEIPTSLAQFKGTDNMTDVLCAYGIPAAKLRYSPDQKDYMAKLDRGIFLFNDDWSERLSRISEFVVHTRPTFPFIHNNVYTDTALVHTAPGTVYVAVEYHDKNRKYMGVSRELLNIRNYSGVDMMISDILLADEISVTADRAIDRRSNFNIRQNVGNRFSVFHPVYVYWELYNLMTDPITLQSRYRVTCTIELQNEQNSDLWQFLRKIRGKDEIQTGFITTTSTYEGDSGTNCQYMRIVMANAPPGNYKISLTVKDLISQREAIQEANIKLIPLQPSQEDSRPLNQEVLQDVLMTLASMPYDPLTLYHVGVMYYNADQTNLAIEYLLKSLQNSKDKDGCAPVHYALALAYMEKGLLWNAMAHINKVSDLYGKVAAFRATAGTIAAAMGLFESAVDLLENYMDNDDAQALVTLAGVYLSPGSIDLGISCLEQAQLINPDLPEAFHLAGLALMQTNRRRDALLALSKAHRIDPRFSPLFDIPHREVFKHGATYSLFVETECVNGGVDSTHMKVRLMMKTSINENRDTPFSINARLRLYDRQWADHNEWLWRREAFLPEIAAGRSRSWVQGTFDITCPPGHYKMTVLTQDDDSHIRGYFVKDIFVPSFEEGSMVMGQPGFNEVGNLSGYNWLSINDTLQLQVRLPTNKPIGYRQIRINVHRFLKHKQVALAKWLRLDNRRILHNETYDLEALSHDHIFKLKIPLTRYYSHGSYTVVAELLNDRGEVDRSAGNRFIVGDPVFNSHNSHSVVNLE